MQFIKNGKLYDTETAELCFCHTEYIHTPKDEYDMNVKNNLFKKKNGEFFILKEEEHLTPYGRRRSYIPPTVTPLTEEEARKWGEEHLSVSLYQETFGKVEE